MSSDDFSATETRIELLAGIHPSNRQPIFEQVLVTPTDTEDQYKLLKSPLFVRGVAAQDVVSLQKASRGRFDVVSRSGVLALRVFFKSPDPDLETQLSAEMEKLGGSLDIQSERALAYSIHFGVGFSSIENLISQWIGDKQVQWNYGNVYDPETGEPLNWWQDMLNA